MVNAVVFNIQVQQTVVYNQFVIIVIRGIHSVYRIQHHQQQVEIELLIK
jgi:hypothetical protein